MPKKFVFGKKNRNPNKCKKVKGCKVAKGTKKNFLQKD